VTPVGTVVLSRQTRAWRHLTCPMRGGAAADDHREKQLSGNLSLVYLARPSMTGSHTLMADGPRFARNHSQGYRSGLIFYKRPDFLPEFTQAKWLEYDRDFLSYLLLQFFYPARVSCDKNC